VSGVQPQVRETPPDEDAASVKLSPYWPEDAQIVRSSGDGDTKGLLKPEAAGTCATVDFVANNMVGWYRGNGNAQDATAIQSPGTLTGGAGTNAVGMVGTAFGFDGSTGYVELNNGTGNEFVVTTGLAMDAWINMNALPAPGAYQPVIARWSNTTTDRSYFLGVRNNGGVLQAVAAVQQANPGPGGTYLEADIPISGGGVGNYVHIGFIYDQVAGLVWACDSGNGNIVSTCFANSGPGGTGVGIAGSPLQLTPTSTTRIGGDNAGRFFNGQVDEAEIFADPAATGNKWVNIFNNIATSQGNGKCINFFTITPPNQTVNEATSPAVQYSITRTTAPGLAAPVYQETTGVTYFTSPACPVGHG